MAEALDAEAAVLPVRQAKARQQGIVRVLARQHGLDGIFAEYASPAEDATLQHHVAKLAMSVAVLLIVDAGSVFMNSHFWGDHSPANV